MPKDNKEIKRKIDLVDERSDLVKEILGRTPNWTIRWGISVVFMIVIFLIVGASVIRYNDIIPAQVVITSKNPPVYLKANTSGRLSRVFVEAEQSVKKMEVLAEIENTADYEDAIFLSEKLEDFSAGILALDSLEKEFPSYLDLGPMQPAYGEFLTQYQNYLLFNILEPTARESALLQRQLSEQKLFLRQQQSQLKTFIKDLELSKSSLDRNEELYKKGVISKAEYEQESRNFLADQQQYEGFLTTISNTKIAIANYSNQLTKSTIQGTEFENTYKQQLDKAYQNLKTELLQWQQTYLIRSPISGKVTLFDIWDQYQNVEVGEVLFTVLPNDLEEIIGRVTLPLRNSGKVKEGQPVIIKLANYPFEEWGSLKGKIAHISEVPKQGEQAFYTLYIEVDGLQTSYGKEIVFKQEMQGSAEIVIEELTVMQRIFYQLRKIFTRDS